MTIPRAPMPAGGWPIAHFIRTGGGGTRPLVDRGPAAVNGGPAIVPGSGPALWFAKAGLAGAMIDGPHEDIRNLTNDNEDFLMFNINNLEALRDNVRESAAEYALFAHTLASLQLDVSDCPGTTSPATFDATHLGLMGHSMGSTIAPLSLADEPLYRIAVLSGAGASWIENVMWKQQPLDIRPVVDLLLRYDDLDPPRIVPEDDPALTLLQWSVEPADPLVYTRQPLQEPPPGQSPRPVLMEQGIVDHYIMPNIANATSLSLGLDLAGTPLDATNAELVADGTPTLESVLPYSGRHPLMPPVAGNYASGLTAVVVQHPSDGIEDGHEMVFQTDPPKREYRCFLQTWIAGQTPLLPVPRRGHGRDLASSERAPQPASRSPTSRAFCTTASASVATSGWPNLRGQVVERLADGVRGVHALQQGHRVLVEHHVLADTVLAEGGKEAPRALRERHALRHPQARHPQRLDVPLASRSRAATIASMRAWVTRALQKRRDGAREIHPGTPSQERRTTVNVERISRSPMRSKWSRRPIASRSHPSSIEGATSVA